MRVLVLAAVLAPACATPAPVRAQVTTAQYDVARTGATLVERVLTPRTVNARSFGRLFSLTVDGAVYAQPLYVPRVAVPGRGRRDLVFVATEADHVYAFDAARPGDPVWHVRLADPRAGRLPLTPSDVHCPLIAPTIGITSTPVIDPAAGVMYLVARTRERDASGAWHAVQRLHALDIATGDEARGGPVVIRAAASGRRGRVEFDPALENQRAALLLDHGVIYVMWSGSCDSGPYHGWVIAYDARTLARVAAFATTPDAYLGGIWQSDAGPAADAAGNVYAITGNGAFDADQGGHDYGNTVLKLRRTDPSGTLAVVDYFTPSEQRTLDAVDADLGSQGPVLVPGAHGARPLLLFATKGAGLFVLDRDRLGGFHPDHDAHAVQHTARDLGFCFGAAAVWQEHVYVGCARRALRDYRLHGDTLPSRPRAEAATRLGASGATPVVSAHGDHDGIVWVIDAPSWSEAPRPAVLRAYDALDVRRELYDSEMHPARDRAGRGLRFAMPTVADGRVYVAGDGRLDVYGLLHDRRTPSPTPASSPPREAAR